MSDSRDFTPPMLWPPPQEEKPPTPFDADVEAGLPQNAPQRASQEPRESTHSETSQHTAPVMRRRRSRAGTVWGNLPAVVDNPHRLAWEPGQEPGLDPSQPNGGRDQQPDLHTECDITVVDFSEDDMVMRHLTNESLPLWLAKTESLERLVGEEQWVKCRWINVNGLSWDVIQALGKYKKLHRLAIEDMLNTKNRTKADWYSDHTYIVMTLQKLVKLPEDSDSDSDSEAAMKNHPVHRARQASTIAEKSWPTKLFDLLLGSDNPHGRRKSIAADLATSHEPPDPIERKSTPPQPRTLQRYNGGPNVERMTFMEQHSAMARKNLAVCAEQVSIFLLSSNTVISFFESSAEDVEAPILKRLATPETILRRSCDASMLTQAIIDAIIDLAMPIATTYSEIIQELELDVLTSPSIRHTRDLYILTSETNTMRNFISPIATLVRAIRDHKSEPRGAIAGMKGPTNPVTTANNNESNPRYLSRRESAFASSASSLSSGIEISGMAYTYLGDVEDHCISIVSELDQIAASAAGMISLIFQTVSAYQNESMRQLTTVTIIFLPLTFITGYFGMNLDHFPSLNNGEPYFWSIAAPVAIGTGLLLMRQAIGRWIWKWVGKWGRRRRRLGREKRAREKKMRKEA